MIKKPSKVTVKKDFLSTYKQYTEKYTKSFKEEDRQRYLAYLYVIFTLFSVTFFGLFAIRPSFATISELNKKKEDNIRVLDGLKKKLEDIQSLEQDYARLANDLALVYEAIPRSPRIPVLSRQLETLAYSNNLAVAKIDFGAIELYPGTKPNEPLYSFTFSITVQGNETGINNFISQAISMTRLVSIDRIATGRANNNEFQSTIAGRAYYFYE